MHNKLCLDIKTEDLNTFSKIIYTNIGVERDPNDIHLDTINRTVQKDCLAAYRNGNINYVKDWHNTEEHFIGTRSHARHSTVLARFGVAAAIGTAFLVTPMWLMMLNTDLYTALISTTVFIVVFGGTMASVLEKKMEVLARTAAYAAVLVVFVGLTRSPG